MEGKERYFEVLPEFVGHSDDALVVTRCHPTTGVTQQSFDFAMMAFKLKKYCHAHTLHIRREMQRKRCLLPPNANSTTIDRCGSILCLHKFLVCAELCGYDDPYPGLKATFISHELGVITGLGDGIQEDVICFKRAPVHIAFGLTLVGSKLQERSENSSKNRGWGEIDAFLDVLLFWFLF